MLTLPPSVRIYAAVEPVDARKSFDGLAAVVRERLGGDPMTGHMFFFINRRKDVAQILFWDRTGNTPFDSLRHAGGLIVTASGHPSASPTEPRSSIFDRRKPSSHCSCMVGLRCIQLRIDELWAPTTDLYK